MDCDSPTDFLLSEEARALIREVLEEVMKPEWTELPPLREKPE